MEKNVGLSFDASIKSIDAKKNIHVPIARKKTNTKIKKVSESEASFSSLNSEIKVDDLVIDLSYQRYPNENKVNEIVKNFDMDAVGVIICSMRDDGTLAVLDGGHRVAALRMLGLNDSTVNCLVYFGLSIEDEANIFNMMNDNRTKPKTNDLFKAKVVAKDADSVALNKIFEKHKLSVLDRPANNGIRAIGTISKIFKKYGGNVVDDTLHVLKNAFDSHSSSFTDVAIMAVSKILYIYKDIDKKRLTNALKNQHTAALWANNGATLSAQISPKDRSVGMAVLLVKDYNKKLKINRLDEKLIW